jgi:hypothetical protein
VWSKLRHENILELLGLALFKGRLAMVSAWMDLGSIVLLVNERPQMNRYKLVRCLSFTFGCAADAISLEHTNCRGRSVSSRRENSERFYLYS